MPDQLPPTPTSPPDLRPVWAGFPWLERGYCDCGETADYGLDSEALCWLCAEGPPEAPR